MAKEINKKARQIDTGVNINPAEILYACLSRWYWFIISLTIALGIATYKIATTQPTYTRYCEVLIKSKTKSPSLDEQMANFANMGIRTTTNAYNEIYTFRASEVMTKVAQRLNLKMRYESKGLFHPQTLYGESLPVTIEFYDIDEESRAAVTIDITPEGTFTLYDLKNENGIIEQNAISGELNDGIALAETPLGKIIIRKNSYINAPATITATQIGLQAAAASVGGRLSFNLQDQDSEIITISISDSSIERADDILSTLIAVYNENWIEDKNKAAEGTLKFIEERLDYISGELEDVDNDISSYKSRNLLPNITASTSIHISKNRANINTLQKLNNDLQSMKEMQQKLLASNTNEMLPLGVTLSNNSINNQITDYNQSLIERNELAQKSSDNNPVIKKLNLALAAKREAIIAAVKTTIKKTETEIEALEEDTKKTIEEISKNPEQTKYLASAEREQSVKEKLYLFLLQKREENQLSQAFTAYKTRIITTPTGSTTPTAPIKKNSIMMAIIIGLAIPGAIIVLREVSNTRVRGRKDIENITAPIIGEIPQFGTPVKKSINPFAKKNKKNSKITIAVQDGSRNIINEAFRVLRTNIEFLTRDKEHNVIIGTSFNPGSGKTFCIINTAISLAIKGDKIIVIDGDMRHASLSTYVSSPGKGISNYLAGEIEDVNDIIIPDAKYPNLHILPVGTIPPNPTELLENPRFSALIEKFKQEYKYVLIDCPPIDMVADTHIMEKLADRTIFLVRANVMERSMIPELETLYSENKLKNIAVILNGVYAGSNRYGYKYSYRYGYHNSYHYGYEQK